MVGDRVLCAERGEKLSGERYSVVLREGRYQAVGDRVLRAKRGKKLIVGRYSVLC